MHESLSSTVQLSFTASYNAERLIAASRQYSANNPDVSVQDVMAYCYAQQLVDDSAFNAVLIDGMLSTKQTVDLGFALALPTHLIVPVIRNASALTIDAIAAERRRLSEAAVAGTLSATAMQGASSTISNLGRGRVEGFTPILNAPQVALLGVAAIQQRPWIGDDGALGIAPIGTLSLTVDHRAIDGAPANAFLSALCARLEHL